MQRPRAGGEEHKPKPQRGAEARPHRASLLRPRRWGFLLGQWVTARDKQGGCRALEKLPWLWVAGGLEVRHGRQKAPPSPPHPTPGGYGQNGGGDGIKDRTDSVNGFELEQGW